MIFTSHSDEHLSFLDSLVFEVYDKSLRRRIHEFYRANDLKVWLPGELDGGKLKYLVEFDDGYNLIELCGEGVRIWQIQN